LRFEAAHVVRQRQYVGAIRIGDRKMGLQLSHQRLKGTFGLPAQCASPLLGWAGALNLSVARGPGVLG
jgi:hypothetical protein